MALDTPDRKDELLARIEGLWQEAAAAVPGKGGKGGKSDDGGKSEGAGVPEDDFAEVRARFDAVSKLQPQEESGSAFGHAFDDLVRSMVRDYVESDLAEMVRTAVLGEIQAHRGESGAASGKTKAVERKEPANKAATPARKTAKAPKKAAKTPKKAAKSAKKK